MEQRLMDDVIAESSEYGGHILVLTEEGSGKLDNPHELVLHHGWRKAEASCLQTPRQLHESIAAKLGVHLEYHRVPVTDEHAMDISDFDEVTKIVSEIFLDPNQTDVAIIFNCQMGQGRTTTGMTAATLLWQLRDHNWLAPQISEPVSLSDSQVISIAITGKLAGKKERTRGAALRSKISQSPNKSYPKPSKPSSRLG